MQLHPARLIHLPPQLQILVQARLASTSTASSSNTPFPYPKHPRPTPYQIFHLQPGASQQDIKARYYDLVRVYHPDSPHSRTLPHPTRHARFQSITSAYDILRGKAPSLRFQHDSHFSEEIARRRRAHSSNYWRHDHPRYDGPGGFAYGSAGVGYDDRWKDKVIVAFALLSLAAGFLPAMFMPSVVDKRHLSASANLAQARKEAREFGAERRRAIRRRVQENELRQRELEERGLAGKESRRDTDDHSI